MQCDEGLHGKGQDQPCKEQPAAQYSQGREQVAQDIDQEVQGDGREGCERGLVEAGAIVE